MITIIFILRQEKTRRAAMSAIATRSNPDPIVIASAIRTPLGRFTGALAGMPANELGAAAIRAELAQAGVDGKDVSEVRAEEHTSELQSLMRNSYAVFCLKKNTEKSIHIM